MQANPVLKRLGFSEDDRLVIIHTDDIGMCQASVSAFAELDAFGLISSGAVMVPCPWFLEAAAYARKHSETDLGIHLTLTSEWDTFRWGPISTRDPSSGLIDPQGYFFHRSEKVQEQADPEAAHRELEAQIERALAAGMRPTHIDTHMGTVAHIKFIPTYLQLALKYGLPMMMFRYDAAGWRQLGLEGEAVNMAVQMVSQLEEMGIPLLDHLSGLELDRPDLRMEQARDAFAALAPGLTHFIIHPSHDTPELRAITPDWRARVADHRTFMSEDLRDFVSRQGITVIGYRAIQELMPSGT